MSRYIERAENVARFIDVNLQLMLDLPSGSTQQWEPMVTTTGDHDAFSERYSEASKENVFHFLTFDRENSNSIVSCLRAARENARSVRDFITTEMWEQVNKYYLMVTDPTAESRAINEPYEFFNEIRMASALFTGLTDATLSRGDGWHFIRMGRLLERADKTSRILDVKYFLLLPSLDDVGTPVDDIQWGALLRSASAFEMYRKRMGSIDPRLVVEFLLLDREFPRAILRCLTKADESIHVMSGTPMGTFGDKAEQRLGQLRSELAYTQVQEILTTGLHEFLDNFQRKLNAVGEAIYETFFAMRTLETRRSSMRSIKEYAQ